MILWALSLITLSAAVMAAFVGDIRRATLALWVAGLGIGGIYLSVGAEVLAIIQWVVSTLIAISFIFFSVMFGEYGAGRMRMDRKALIGTGLALAAGAAFAVTAWMGFSRLSGEQLAIPGAGNDLAALGKSLTEDHLLSVEVLALTLFLVLIGGGVVARPENER